MNELWIKYIDDDGKEGRALVAKDEFFIGRHSSADLCIPSSKLSREHVKIKRVGDAFVASDCGSTNGTRLNGSELTGAVPLKNGDKLDLGGGPKAFVELNSGGASEPEQDVEIEEPAPSFLAEPASVESSAPSGVMSSDTASGNGSGSSIPIGVFILVPVLGIVLLLFAGGLIYIFSSGGKANTPADDEFVYTKDSADKPPRRDKDSDTTASDTKPAGDLPTNGVTSASPEPAVPVSTTNLSDTAKSEQNAASFLRKIAQNDPKAFLTREQAERVNTKIKQLSSSPALVDNINSARRSGPQIKSLASAKNLQPQFLATAALTKLGTSRGDVFQTAQGIADIYDKLATQIGNELADDCLLMVAAYNQGAVGDFMKLRNTLQALATQFPESSRSIRTIWFLKQNGKITQGEFDNAVSFLAIGTIMQNPKAFGVDAEAVTF